MWRLVLYAPGEGAHVGQSGSYHSTADKAAAETAKRYHIWTNLSYLRMGQFVLEDSRIYKDTERKTLNGGNMGK